MPPIWDWVQSLGNPDLQQPESITPPNEFRVDASELEAYRMQIFNPVEDRIATFASRNKNQFDDPLRCIQGLQVGQHAVLVAGAADDQSDTPLPSRLRLVQIKQMERDPVTDKKRVFAQFLINKDGSEFDLMKPFAPTWRLEAKMDMFPDPDEIGPDILRPLPFDIMRPTWKSAKGFDAKLYRAVDEIVEVNPSQLVCNEIVLNANKTIPVKYHSRIKTVHNQMISIWNENRRAATRGKDNRMNE